MLDWIFIGITFAAATGLAFHTYKLLAYRPHRCATENIDLPSGIPVSDIGIIEHDILNLTSVMVVAHKVEPPTSTLAKAVDHNFKRKVKYTFLVSKDNESEVDGYYQVFKAYALVASKLHPNVPLSDLIEILWLPYN